MKTILKTFVLFLFSSLSVFAQIPTGYYNTANGLTGTQLQQALHDIIDDHIEYSYDDLIECHSHTDVKPNGKVWDMYSDIPDTIPPYEFTFFTDKCGNYGSESDCYNREHSWPKSWFNDMSPMFSDLFHLYPTDGYVNGRRSNYPFGEVDGSASWTSLNGSKLGSCSYPGYSGTVFEPIDAYKGDFARTYFYMATRYYGEDSGWSSSGNAVKSQLTPWTLAMMLEWAVQDPVSQKEIDRNNIIYNEYQHNRNPFIDNPQYAFDIWAPNSLSVSLNASETINCGDSITLNPTITYSDESQLTFEWSPTEGLSNPNIKNPIAKPSSTTTYTLTVSCPSVCESVNSTTINVSSNDFNTNFTVVTSTIVEKPYTALFYNTTPNLSNYTFEWNFGDNSTSTSSNYSVVHEYANAGIYTVSLKTINGTNCSETLTKENSVQVLDTNLTVSLNADETIECGESITLNPTITYSDLNTLTFSWSPSLGLSNPNIQNPIANPTSTTIYTLTVSCVSGCQKENVVTINVNNSNDFGTNFTVVTDSIINKPYTALFYNTTPNLSNYTFEWNFGDSSIVANNSYAVVHEYADSGDYTVSLKTSNGTSCTEILEKISCVHTINTSGIISEKQNSQFEIFPNPASEFLNIINNSKSEINIEILNSIGQKIYELKTKNSSEKINVSQFENNALYFISIRNFKLNKVEMMKFIIRRF